LRKEYAASQSIDSKEYKNKSFIEALSVILLLLKDFVIFRLPFLLNRLRKVDVTTTACTGIRGKRYYDLRRGVE